MITDNKREVLMGLEPAQGSEPDWLRPMDVGGHDGSHHSGTLAKLTRRGWVESMSRGSLSGARPGKLYRITRIGMGELRALKQAWGQRR